MTSPCQGLSLSSFAFGRRLENSRVTFVTHSFSIWMRVPRPGASLGAHGSWSRHPDPMGGAKECSGGGPLQPNDEAQP